VMTGLRSIANETGVTIVAGHHLNKAKGVGAILERIRGSIAIPAGVDTAFLLTVEGDGLEARRTLRQKKNREAVEAPAMVFTIQPGEQGGLMLAFDRASAQGIEKVKDAIRDALAASGRLNTSQLKRDIGGRGANVNAALADMERTGEISGIGGPRGSRIYELRPVPVTRSPLKGGESGTGRGNTGDLFPEQVGMAGNGERVTYR